MSQLQNNIGRLNNARAFPTTKITTPYFYKLDKKHFGEHTQFLFHRRLLCVHRFQRAERRENDFNIRIIGTKRKQRKKKISDGIIILNSVAWGFRVCIEFIINSEHHYFDSWSLFDVVVADPPIIFWSFVRITIDITFYIFIWCRHKIEKKKELEFDEKLRTLMKGTTLNNC